MRKSEKITPASQAKDPGTPAEVLTKLAREDVSLSRLVARNPSTPIDMLRELGSSKDTTTRKWVTTNPNTPANVLVSLATQFPIQLLDNPVFDFLLLENPNLFGDMPLSSLGSMLKRDNCPHGILTYAAAIEDEKIQLALLQNANTPSEIILRLSLEGLTEAIRIEARQHVNHPDITEMSAEEAENSIWNEVVNRFLTARFNPHNLVMPDQIPVAVRKKVIMMLAGRLDRLGIMARIAIAMSPDTEPEILSCLAGDPRNHVREVVFRNTNLPNWLRTLGKGRVPTRKTWLKNIAEHSDYIDIKLEAWSESGLALHMYLLLNYQNPPVRLILKMLKRGDVPEELREMLLKQGDPEQEILESIMVYPDDFGSRYVARHSRETAAMLERLVLHEDAETRRLLAENGNTSAQSLIRLSNDSDKDVRKAVAKNQKTPVDVLAGLAVDKSSFVRAAVAASPNTPEKLLECLAEDEDQGVRYTVANNLNTPVRVLSHLLRDKAEYVRISAANSPNMPIEILMSHSDNESDIARSLLAMNPKTPEEMLVSLSEDKGRTR